MCKVFLYVLYQLRNVAIKKCNEPRFRSVDKGLATLKSTFIDPPPFASLQADLAYGSIPLSSLRKHIIPCLTEHSVLFDVGCGDCQAAFYCALLSKCYAFGVEKILQRYK